MTNDSANRKGSPQQTLGQRALQAARNIARDPKLRQSIRNIAEDLARPVTGPALMVDELRQKAARWDKARKKGRRSGRS
jgi:sensor histidine kinase regulating citrate/malate metabolism